MNQNYSEGTWFAVPLKQAGFAVGVVARAASGKPIALCYFFPPISPTVPTLNEVSLLEASAAILVSRVGDLGLVRGDWPIIGKAKLWRRSDWPMPVFLRREKLPPFRNWRVYYSDNDPNTTTKEEIEPNERLDLPSAVLSGPGAVKIKLTALLKADPGNIGPQSPSIAVPPRKIAEPPPLGAGPFRNDVLQQLSDLGSDIRKPHSFDFYLYFPLKTAALDAAAKLRENRFAPAVVLAARGNTWLCKATKILVPESAPLDEINKFLGNVATSLDGEFDGWESSIVKS